MFPVPVPKIDDVWSRLLVINAWSRMILRAREGVNVSYTRELARDLHSRCHYCLPVSVPTNRKTALQEELLDNASDKTF